MGRLNAAGVGASRRAWALNRLRGLSRATARVSILAPPSGRALPLSQEQDWESWTRVNTIKSILPTLELLHPQERLLRFEHNDNSFEGEAIRSGSVVARYEPSRATESARYLGSCRRPLFAQLNNLLNGMVFSTSDFATQARRAVATPSVMFSN